MLFPHEIIFPFVYRYEVNETFIYLLITVKATGRVFENDILLILMEGRYLTHQRPMFPIIEKYMKAPCCLIIRNYDSCGSENLPWFCLILLLD